MEFFYYAMSLPKHFAFTDLQNILETIWSLHTKHVFEISSYTCKFRLKKRLSSVIINVYFITRSPRGG